MEKSLSIEDIKKGIIITTNTLYNNIKRTLPKNSLELSQVNKFRLDIKHIVDGMDDLDNDLSYINLKQDIFEMISRYMDMKKELKFLLEDDYRLFNLNNSVVEILYFRYLMTILEED